MRFKVSLIAITALFVAASTVITACAPRSLSDRLDLAHSYALDNQLVSETFEDVGRFPLFSYHRFSNPASNTLRVYIEGDGFAYLSKYQVSPDPTPRDPIALKLASLDKDTENVLYIARPCQYVTPRNSPDLCDIPMWTTHRYSEEVVLEYQALLNKLSARHGFTNFELIGYSGGGVIAAILSATRDDVTSLRTVAGNIDVKAFTTHHSVPALTQSLDSADYSATLLNFPQCHYIGQKDKVVTEDVTNSFLYKQNPSLTYIVQHKYEIADVSHDEGWEKVWPTLIKSGLSPEGACIKPPVKG